MTVSANDGISPYRHLYRQRTWMPIDRRGRHRTITPLFSMVYWAFWIQVDRAGWANGARGRAALAEQYQGIAEGWDSY